ncbi:MAG: hypothetical protein WC444_07555, partial [Candidatus Paceibacterota bacterium]
ELKDLEDSSGVTEMRDTITMLRQRYVEDCKQMAHDGITQDGPLRLIDRSRYVRKVNVERFTVIDKGAYEQLKNSLTIPVGVVEKFYDDVPNKREIMDAICDTTKQESYDIVDVMEGD